MCLPLVRCKILADGYVCGAGLGSSKAASPPSRASLWIGNGTVPLPALQIGRQKHMASGGWRHGSKTNPRQCAAACFLGPSIAPRRATVRSQGNGHSRGPRRALQLTEREKPRFAAQFTLLRIAISTNYVILLSEPVWRDRLKKSPKVLLPATADLLPFREIRHPYFI